MDTQIGKQQNKNTPNDKATKLNGIVSYFDENGDTQFKKSNRASVALTTTSSIEGILSDSSQYDKIASTNLANILYPFSTDPNNSQPMYESGVNFQYNDIHIGNLTPFHYSSSGVVLDNIDTTTSASGGSWIDVKTGSGYIGDINKNYNPNSVTGMGIRLPLIGVGWGYDANGNPAPSSLNDASLFKGDVSDGRSVDPKDYIAAPIDIRYDTERGVWTTVPGEGGGEGMDKHQHLVNSAGDGGPAFAGFFR